MKTRVYKYSFGQPYTTYWATEFDYPDTGPMITLWSRWDDAIAEACRLEKSRGWE